MGIVLRWSPWGHCRETEAGKVSPLSAWSSPAPRVGRLERLLSIDYEVRVKLVWGTERLGLCPLRWALGAGIHRCPSPRETALGNLSPLAGLWPYLPVLVLMDAWRESLHGSKPGGIYL